MAYALALLIRHFDVFIEVRLDVAGFKFTDLTGLEMRVGTGLLNNSLGLFDPLLFDEVSRGAECRRDSRAWRGDAGMCRLRRIIRNRNRSSRLRHRLGSCARLFGPAIQFGCGRPSPGILMLITGFFEALRRWQLKIRLVICRRFHI